MPKNVPNEIIFVLRGECTDSQKRIEELIIEFLSLKVELFGLSRTATEEIIDFCQTFVAVNDHCTEQNC